MTLKSQQATQQQSGLPSAVPKATASDTTAPSADDEEGMGLTIHVLYWLTPLICRQQGVECS